LHIEYAALSDQGRIRKSNEDFFITNPDNMIFLVADGMGGHAAGEIASQITAETIEETISESTGVKMPDLLPIAVEKANDRVFQTQKQRPECRGMGSTLTLLTFHDGDFYVTQVGDSRAYLLRNNEFRQLTRDHSLVWPLYESGVLSKDALNRHPKKNLITRSIGTQEQVEPEIQNGEAHKDDIYLLCSDGLTDVLSDQELFQIVSAENSGIREICDHLVKAANQGGGPDNITVVLAKVISV
jgi:PPM family protein phosphatase